MRGCVARARSDLSLKFLANGTVDRIRAAAADRDDQACSADQEHILVSAARCITPGQGHHQQGHQHLDGERGGEKPRDSREYGRRTGGVAD